MQARVRNLATIISLTFAFSSAAAAQTVLPYSGGYSAAPLSDVNADGIPDYITGGYNSGEIRSGLDGSLIRSFGGSFINAYFSCGTETSCARAGDLDGDGVEDVLFAMPGDQCKFFDPGWIWAYSTVTGQLLWQVTGDSNGGLGRIMTGIGDVNLDGIPDVALAAMYSIQIRSGANGALLHNFNNLAYKPIVANVGDLNADGLADIVIGEPYFGTKGRIREFAGGTWTLLNTIPGRFNNDTFGASAAAAGDVNQDGLSDILVGVPGYDAGGSNAGAVFIFLGFTTFPYAEMDGRFPNHALGTSCGSPGDVDGDGFPEAAGGPVQTGPTKGYLQIRTGGGGNTIHLVFAGDGASAFGGRMFPMGDMNFDGIPEMAVGSGTKLLFINFAKGLSSYGVGTKGCFGEQILDVNRTPAVGTQDLVFKCNDTSNGGLGLLLVSDAADVAGTDIFQLGFVVHVGIANATFFSAFDMFMIGDGSGETHVSIPNNPLLAGNVYYAQALIAWPGGVPCTPTYSGISSSIGLALTIQ
ncbi:MAG: VCBS repeat-containing protein [Planctomycetes bacterium]|nr:VCBS repeat-containing protein [Planctomycetota bacterium]